MPASLTAALAAAVVTALWLVARRRPPLIRNADTSAVAALNRAQIALVQAGGGDPAGPCRPGRPVGPPKNSWAQEARNRLGAPARRRGP